MSASSHYMRLIQFGHAVLHCPHVAANYMLYPRPAAVAGHVPDVAFHDGERILAVGLVLDAEHLATDGKQDALRDYLAKGVVVAVAGLDLKEYRALADDCQTRGLATERLLYVESSIEPAGEPAK